MTTLAPELRTPQSSDAILVRRGDEARSVALGDLLRMLASLPAKAAPASGDQVLVYDADDGECRRATLGNLENAASTITTLGDLLYGGAAGVETRLGGNASADKKFLSQKGTGTASAAPTWEAVASSMGITVDNAGSAITTGLKGFLVVPYACKITGWSIVGDQSGSAVIDIWKAAGAIPTNSNSITASAPPTLTTAQLGSSSTLTGWTVDVAAGDVIGFYVDSAATITRLTLQLTITRA